MNRNKDLIPESLKRFFAENTRIALAFSGGCDSAYLLYAATICGVDLGIYYVHSQFQPDFELEDARMLCDQLGQSLQVLEMDVLADERIRLNPADRCYHCKQRIFGAIMDAARRDGYEKIMDGTNASDDASDRPGMRALREMQVVSPLRFCGITKQHVRELSRKAGLFTWDKPAYACLATRIPSGQNIDLQILKRVEGAEAGLARLGFSGMRVRIENEDARLELREEQMPLALERRDEIIRLLERDFRRITLDLRPRREK